MAYKGSKTQRSRIKGLSQAGNKAASDARLDNFIKSNQDLKNQSTLGSILSTVSDKPQRFSKNNESRKAFIERNLRADGTPNSAAQAMLDFYDTGRNDYQRGLNSLRTSSPEMMKAYARRFPAEDFAMNMGPTIAGAMSGMPLGLLERGFDAARQGFDFAKSGFGKGLDALTSGIDKGMHFVEDRLDDITDTIEYDTPIGELPEAKDKIVDIFEDAIAKKVEPSTFTAQNIPGNFRENFESFLADVPQQDIEKLDPLRNQKLSPATGNFLDTNKGFGTHGVPSILNQGAFNTRNQINPNNQFDVAELTEDQINFMRRPEQSLDFQSPDSLFNKVKALEDKGGLFGWGAQEPTTREEFEEFIKSGGIARAANGGMMGGISSLDPRYTMRSNASNFSV